MSLLVFEGFDHYNSPTTDFLARSGVLQWTQESDVTISTDGRTGFGKSIQMGQLGFLRGNINSNPAEFIIGFGFKMISPQNPPLSGPDSSWNLFFEDGLSEQCHITFNGQLAQVFFVRGSTTLWSSTLNAFPLDTWNFMEVKITVDNSAGTFALRINGQPVVSLTGLDTQQTGNAYVNSFFVTCFNSSNDGWLARIDDLYINDTVVDPGPYPMNDFAGDLRCRTLFALGNDSVQWTPLANTNWQEISEVAMDSDTSYNTSATAGQQDTFNYNQLAATVDEVIAVQITGAYRKTVAGSPIVNQAIKSGATTGYGANISVPNNYAYFTDIFKQDPDTSSNWTAASVNAMKAGYKLVST